MVGIFWRLNLFICSFFSHSSSWTLPQVNVDNDVNDVYDDGGHDDDDGDGDDDGEGNDERVIVKTITNCLTIDKKNC